MAENLAGDAQILRHTLAPLPFAAALIGADGRIVATNALFDREWGADFPLPDTRTLGEIVHPDDLTDLAALLAGIDGAAPSANATLELRFLDAGGGLRHALAGFTAAAESGTAPLIVMQLAPLDAQKRREAGLAALEERWRHALTGSQLGVWDHDFRTGKFNFSQLWLAIRGYDAAIDIHHDTDDWIDQVHPDDRTHVLEAIERQNRNDPEYAAFRYRVRHRLGHWIWIECRGACVEWDENGNPLRVAGTDADVTSRKGWEDDMTLMSRRLQLALEISRIGVFEADIETGESSWDERMYSIYEVPQDTEIRVGTVWESMLHPEDAERVLRKVDHQVDNLLPFSDEYRIIRRDGTIGHIRSRAMPFIDSVSGHRKLIGANWDVTEDVALHREIRHARDLAEARNRELEAARARIEHNALHDHLTGLPNRRYLDQVLDGHTAGDGESGLAILHIDLDRFKQINDTQGHAIGDAMLRHTAGVLKRCVRPQDFVARIGGDEFVLVSHFEGQPRHLAPLAGRIIRRLCKPMTIDGHECRIGASIGIASQKGCEQDARQLLQNADIALYRAKNLGRNRYEFFSTEMQNEIVSAKKTSDEILLALERDEFVPWYQFQFEAKELAISGVETLARWQHPEKGVLTPDRFLAIAEDLDAVAAIDARILEKALADFRRWQREGLGIPKVSVNVSARRLHDAALYKSVRNLGIEPGTVSFELLESVFLDDYDSTATNNLAKLRALGIDIEIDDFGSGHASIVGLVRLGPKTLKIDRELIQPILQSPEQRRLVGSIIEIGRSLNIRVVAEGVETFEHIRILRDLGCDAFQGYALARPMPACDVAAFVRSGAWRRG